MNEIDKRLLHIKWLKTNGVKYHCSNKIQKTLKPFEQQISEIQNSQLRNAPIIAQIDKKPNKIITAVLTNNKENEMKNNDNISLARTLANESVNLEDLYERIRNFEGCGLKQFAQNTVLFDGQKNAKIMFIGEAPGATEDELGKSFCGESGKLLDSMIKSIGISRETNAYITNTVFWRPPANRKPTNEEIELCRPFVEKHIALINPSLIILVGATATTSLLNQGESISNLRGKIYLYKNQYIDEPIKTTAIFHPAYLLRQPYKKKDTWYDLLKVKDILTKYNI